MSTIDPKQIQIILSGIPKEWKDQVHDIIKNAAVSIDAEIKMLKGAFGGNWMSPIVELFLRQRATNAVMHNLKAVVTHAIGGRFNTQTVNNLILQIVDEAMGVPGYEPDWWHESISGLPV
jgi:hypothetical protein